MANKLKTYIIFTLLAIGLVFLGTGCVEENTGGSSPSPKPSSEGAQVQEATTCEAPGIVVKGSDTILLLTQAEA